DPELEKQLKEMKDRGFETPADLLAAADRDRAVVQKLAALLKKEKFDQPDLLKGLDDFLANKSSDGGKQLKDVEAKLTQQMAQLAEARKTVDQLTEARKTAETARQTLAKENQTLAAKEEEAKKASANLAQAKRQADARLSEVGEELKKAKVSDGD